MDVQKERAAALARGRSSRPTALGRALALVLLAALLVPAAALGQRSGQASPTPVPGGYPATPADYSISAERALRIADRDANVAAERRDGAELTASISTEPVRRWEVAYSDAEERVVLVVVDGLTGEVVESWTGEQVAWPMARGREGQFGHILNAPYVWLPLCAIFLLGLLDWRRPLRIAHLDLLVLLSFGVSHLFFNSAEIGVSVPLAYPPLLYLLARMLWVGFRGGGEGLRPSAPTRLLLIAAIVLLLFRVTINIADSGVIDVGYAGVVGADRIADAEPIYGEDRFPADNPTGDTYGPANYFAYVPFEQALPWSGGWDALPAAHAAAIFFDLLTIAGLLVLGRRLGARGEAGGAKGWGPGWGPGVVLAFAWVAYPYSAFALQSNSNDSLLAALVVWGLALFGRPLARGALLALATATKFAPLVLAPLYAAGERGLPLGRAGWAGRRRPLLLFAAGLLLATALLFAHPAVDPGLGTFWERTIGSQAGRVSPFSIWGQADLGALHTAVKLAVAALAVLLAFRPRRRSLAQLCALAAALLIAIELVAEHWFYLYLVWFLPPLLAALLPRESPQRPSERARPERPAS